MNDLPDLVLRLIRQPSPLIIFLDLLLFFFPFILQLYLFLLCLGDALEICDRSLEGLRREAGLVLQGNSHEGTEAGHPVEVHSRLTHHLLHIEMLEGVQDVVWVSGHLRDLGDFSSLAAFSLGVPSFLLSGLSLA